jgi:hypothetical protein
MFLEFRHDCRCLAISKSGIAPRVKPSGSSFAVLLTASSQSRHMVGEAGPSRPAARGIQVARSLPMD